MGNRFFRLLGLVLLLPYSSATGAEAGKTLVLVSVDGLRPACYLDAGPSGLKVPNLRSLMARGSYARGVIGVLPTVTYPSHTTLITGLPPRAHGIESNSVFDPEKTKGGAWNWYAKYIRGETLISAARKAGLPTATIGWPVTVGMESDWNLPEFWRPGSEDPVDLDLIDAVSTRGLMDEITRDRHRPFSYPLTDDDRLEAASYVIRTRKPAVVLLHLLAVDAASHRYGPYAPEALAAVEDTDARIGLLLRTLKDADLEPGATVAIVSDHGFLPVSTTLQPNTVLREAGVIDVDPAGQVKGWRASFHAHGGGASLILKDPGDEALLAKIKALFEARAKDPASGIRAVLGSERIAELGGAERWSLYLDATEGFDFSGEAKGEWSIPSKSKGNHGFSPERPELYASLIVTGPGLRRLGDLGVIHMTSIASALGNYLELRLSPEADRSLTLF